MKVLCAALLAAGAALADGAPSAEELELVERSLKPEGRAELERNAGPLAAQPLYEVEAELDPAAARVEGRLRLLLQNREAAPLRELVLRLWPEARRRERANLLISEVKVSGEAASWRTHGSVLEVKLSKPLEPGQRLTLSLRFRGKLQRLKRGDDDLLASAMPMLGSQPAVDGYGTFAAGPHGAVLVDWYPQLAVRSAGRWDRREPGRFGDVGRAEPSSTLVALTVPKGFRVAGAGVPLGQHALPDGRESATFAAAGVRGPLGLAVSSYYELEEADEGGVHLRAWSMHGAAGARALLRCGGEALRELSRRFGPYPWTNLALAEAALTGGAGGVEQPGLALVARALSGEGSLGQLMQPSLFQFTCWHEVAHQWWQGVVGSDPREAAWVDEALAQFSAALVAESAAEGAPSRRAGQDALARHVAANFQVMRSLGAADGQAARPTEQFGSVLAYAGLVYGKAPLFFDRVRTLLGDQPFDEAVRSYRAAHAFREARDGSFLAAARAASPEHAKELQALDRRWLREAHGDEDIGPLDPIALLGGDTAELRKMLERLGRPSASGVPDLPELRQMMDVLRKTMPEMERLLESTQGELGQDLPVDEE